jgi:DNA-binding transcriptional MerR regulator
MFSIGEFARHGRVSVRMLRHYDSIGLLRPAHVEAASGYRFYEAAQLSDVNRIVEWSPDRTRWVTELQQPIRPADGN